ncbi:MAG TPA: capsule assembly Wzi family protein [Saprospiraceae bacterium]|nr:capsule assembly Wzi family protein [Saprospiraceae bacterium]
MIFSYRMSLTRNLSILMVIVSLSDLVAQNIISEMDHDARHTYDRMIILGGEPLQMHSSIFPYLRTDLIELANLFESSVRTESDIHDVQMIGDQNNEFLNAPSDVAVSERKYTDSTKTFYYIKDSIASTSYRYSKHPLWKTFYKTPAHFYEVDVKDFYLRVNPMIRISAGRETNEDVTTFINQRGLSVRGGVGKNVYFYTSVYDSQIRFANYVNRFTDQTGVVPGAGFYKIYESAFLKFTEGRDFLLANAYVGVNLGKYVGFQLGHHQHFIGDGIRSLFLSDFSTPFFSLKFNTRIWKLHYQNIFAELAADDFNSVLGSGQSVPKKYMAAHYLSFKPSSTITLGLFETVIFNRPDHRFELQYLNPVILYRTVEGSIGSPDNVMLGLNARWDLKKTISIYGQFLLDDIFISEILDGHMDWWGNKLGHQLGIKYINAAKIENLDIQLEWNQVRPYTYSHYDQNANYAHYNQALAHPLGANFNEWIVSLHYRPFPKMIFQSSLYLINKGEDGLDSTSFGGNILTPNTLRPGDFGNEIGQGINADIIFWTTVISYELSAGLNIDLQYLYRKKTSEIPALSLNTNLFQLGVRLNMARREDIF